jgi:ATP-binding cassette subfamily C (CFTR/MRP) protein 1
MLILYTLLQLAVLIASCIRSVLTTTASVAAATLSFLVACVLCFLSYYEHARSIRPSALIEVYLLFSLLFDISQDRTLWISYPGTLDAGLLTASVGIKFIVLILEAREKRSYLSKADVHRGPEETSGIFGRSLFWWLNHLILQGFRKLLLMSDLYPLDDTMSSQSLYNRFSRVWGLSEPKNSRPVLWTFD